MRSVCSGAGPGASAALRRAESPAAGVEGALSCCGKLESPGLCSLGAARRAQQVCSLTGKRGLEALGPLATSALSGLLSSPFGAW